MAVAAACRSLLEERPFVSAVAVTACKAVAADLMAQLVLTTGSGSDYDPATATTVKTWDVRRTACFATFGFLYQGCAQYVIVNWGWERLFPGRSPRAVISKVCGMNLVSDPFLFLPAFYLFKRAFQFDAGVGFSSFPLWRILREAGVAYKANAWRDVRNSWLVWFPGHAVTYGIMPEHQRIPWMAFLSFFYMCILSLTRGG
jgi:Mpv17 / PMP22 family